MTLDSNQFDSEHSDSDATASDKVGRRKSVAKCSKELSKLIRFAQRVEQSWEKHKAWLQATGQVAPSRLWETLIMQDQVRSNDGLADSLGSAETQPWTEELLRAKGLVTQIQRDLKHDEDWPHMLIVESSSPEHPAIIAITVAIPYDDDEKYAFAMGLRDCLIRCRARAACLISPAWEVVASPGLLERYGRVSRCPNRREILSISSASYGGDSHGCRHATADITRRSGIPPQLANWTVTSNAQGRFLSAIWSALCEVNR